MRYEGIPLGIAFQDHVSYSNCAIEGDFLGKVHPVLRHSFLVYQIISSSSNKQVIIEYPPLLSILL